MFPFRMDWHIIKNAENVEEKNTKGVNSRMLRTDIIKREKGVINAGHFKVPLSWGYRAVPLPVPLKSFGIDSLGVMRPS